MQKIILLGLLLLSGGFVTHAQVEIVPDKHEYIKSEVTKVVFLEDREMFASTTRKVYMVTARLADGTEQAFENDHFEVNVGDKIYVHKRTDIDGTVYFNMDEPVRLPILFMLLCVFILLSIWIGGKQGFKGLLSLAGSIFLLFLILVPSILKGYSPVFVSLCVASVIIVLGSFITHGFNRTTSSAVLGMIVTVCGVGIVTLFLMKTLFLTGVYSEDVVYLMFNTGGAVDATGLLFAGIMIGLLGILYDVAIGQSIAIEELMRADEHMPRTRLIQRGMRIGREHIGALINTLAIAYVGASLPLLLLFSTSDSGILYILNREDISTEIVRILIGSMSIILAVPITTYIAVYILKKYGVPNKKTEGGCAHVHTEGHAGHHHH
jgi:uncharacterized membrane protein